MSERVAVIIPCYNHARYVGEALESVLVQTRKPDRIIVIDDGSKDNSLEVLSAFADRGVEVLSQSNLGAHATINKLVALAAQDCEFVSILNSDDRYLPGRIESCLKELVARPTKTVVSSRLRVMDDKGAVLPEDAPRSRWFHGAWSLGREEVADMAEWLGQANFVATTSNVFARSSYLQANPFRPYRFNHDYFFLASAALDGLLTIVPEMLLEYRVHGSNTISTRPEPLVREMLRMHMDLYRAYAQRLLTSLDLRKRFYGFVRSSWDNISSFHAGLFQVAMAQLAAKCSESEIAALIDGVKGPEMDEFPNKYVAGAFDGVTPLSVAGALDKQLQDLKLEHDQLKKDREALDKLSRYRHLMLRSKWIRLGLSLGLCHSLVSSHGKKPHEKMLYLRERCVTHWWLWLGEKVGSNCSYELRRSRV
ncbi:MAG: glycosyltransferase family A protein [Verrucomicrobiaceae bacterium]